VAESIQIVVFWVGQHLVLEVRTIVLEEHAVSICRTEVLALKTKAPYFSEMFETICLSECDDPEDQNLNTL
jgi:hypothetical protein